MNYRDHPDTITFTASYPAAGKGTVIAKLKEQMVEEDIDHFEVGAMVRRHIKEGTRFGRLTKTYSSQGLLVPDDVILPAIEAEISNLKERSLWLIDGFPRSETQIPTYTNMMKAMERSDRIVHLNISRTEAEDRMILRAQIAEESGEKPRADDVDPRVRKNRLDLAEADTDPIVNHFKRMGKLTVIDASQNINAVVEDVRSAIFAHQLNGVHHREHVPTQSFEHANIA